MNRKIWKALGIAVCMLALAAPRAMAKTYKVWDDIGFKNAVQEINDESSDAENEIVLMQDITLGGNYINYILTNDKTTTTKTTTIKGGGHKISIKSKAEIRVEGEKTVLNLGANGYDKKLTIDGDTTAAFIVVSGGATANMNENVTLQNRQSAGNACILITGSNSVFNMDGGVIEECSRAVIADSGTTFNMSGGEIRNCVSMNDGVGLYADNSIVTIKGGTISECTAGMGAGGGLYATNGSTININSGTISGCEAGVGGGLYVDGSAVTISGGTISGCEAAINEGGGLYATNQSTITISGGTISGCKAPSSDKGNGSGLYANKSTINISGGTISGCEGRWGGGLYA